MSTAFDYRYVRPAKAEQLHASAALSEYRERLSAEVYPNAVILPVRFGERSALDCGGVVTSTGEYLISSVIPGWVAGVYDDYQCHYSEKTAVYCGRMIGHWGHFLLETITRLWYFLEHDDPSYVYVFIVREESTPPIEGNFRQLFDLLGISDRLIFLNQATQYRHVIIPERSFQYKRFYSPHYGRIINHIVQQALAHTQITDPCKRVFLSRSSFARACDAETGLDMLDNYFEINHYQLLHPESMSLAELIVRLQAADECASESGTAAHNFLFCRTGQRVMIMERQTVVNDAQTSIGQVRALHTTYVDSHLTVKPIYTGAGPFFLYYTPWMELLSEDRGYSPPEQRFRSRTYIEKCLHDFEAAFRKIHNASRPVSGSISRHEECLTEACCETAQILKMHNLQSSL